MGMVKMGFTTLRDSLPQNRESESIHQRNSAGAPATPRIPLKTENRLEIGSLACWRPDTTSDTAPDAENPRLFTAGSLL